jgi:hypothetical protein
VRIHWVIVLFTVVGTILLTWHFRTRHLDFMTPQGVTLGPEDDSSDLALGPISLQPKIEENPEVTEVLGNPEEPEEPIVAEISDRELGDLESSPGLNSYHQFAKDNTTERLFELSSTLRTRGQFQRALMAFERVIDTSKTDSASLIEAAKGIKTLAPTLPSWNVDPNSELSLMLHLGTAQEAGDELKSALLEVATLIRTSSSEQLEIIPKITNAGKRDAPEDSPVTLWFDTTENESVSTPVMSFKASEDAERAINEVSAAVFHSVRSQLEKSGYPPAPPLEVAGKDLLNFYITRLMWRDFALSLSKKPDAPEEDSGSN